MSKVKNSTDFQELIHAFLAIENVKEYEAFLLDLCTPMELESMSERWRVARLLDEGIPYRTISEMTGISTTTITRVARALNNGDGGYQYL